MLIKSSQIIVTLHAHIASKMRTLRDFFGGGDLLHLVLVLSLLRVDVSDLGLLSNNLQNRIENEYQVWHKEVLIFKCDVINVHLGALFTKQLT